MESLDERRSKSPTLHITHNTLVLTQDFNEVATGMQMVVHVPEVGVDMVSIPVQRIRLHSQVVTREVAGRIAEVVKLVPEESL